MDDSVILALIGAFSSGTGAFLKYIHSDIKRELKKVRTDISQIKIALGVKVEKEESESLRERMSVVPSSEASNE